MRIGALRNESSVISIAEKTTTIMQRELNVSLEMGQWTIADHLDYSSDTARYYDYIAQLLGCAKDELASVEPFDPINGGDEEGWDLMSFFPAGADLQIKVLYTDYRTPTFTFGEVLEIIYKGERFIADHNASPYNVWCKYEKSDEKVIETDSKQDSQ